MIRDTVQRVKNKLRGDGFRTDRAVEAEQAEDRRADKEQLDAERRERAWRAEQRRQGKGKKKKLAKNVWVDRVDAGKLPPSSASGIAAKKKDWTPSAKRSNIPSTTASD